MGAEAEELGAKASSDPLIGKTIAAKYKILSLLGEGGMSAVYKARQLPINKIVAVKVLLAHLANDENSKQRFIREAKAAGQFSHPNVVSVFDFGFENKYPFLVMDYLEGKTLDEVLRERGFLPYEEALPLFGQICDGLSAAHKNGVIHRDIKPSNIVIQIESNGETRVRIVDFGIAKMVDAESQHLTKTGEIFGSPLYMSPEQCEGVQLDHRSDIYSLGVVFYETLSGKRPFVGQSALETMWQHVEQMPASLQKLTNGARIPLALENIIFKMMAKDRDKRYASVEALRKDLETFAGCESTALSGNLLYVSREISRKSKIIFACAATLTLAAGIIFLSYNPVVSCLGNSEYEQGKAAIGTKSPEAVAHLQKAVQSFRACGEKGKETKALALLIDACKGNSNYDRLRESSRKRRQELVLEVLENFDLGSSSIDSTLSQLSDSHKQLAIEEGAPEGTALATSSTKRERRDSAPASKQKKRIQVLDSVSSSSSSSLSGESDAGDGNEGVSVGNGFGATLNGSAGKLQGGTGAGYSRTRNKISMALPYAMPMPHLVRQEPAITNGPPGHPPYPVAPRRSLKSYGALDKNVPIVADARTAGSGGGFSGPGALKDQASYGASILSGVELKVVSPKQTFDQGIVDDLNAVRVVALRKHLFGKVIDASNRIIKVCEHDSSMASREEQASAYTAIAFSQLMLGDMESVKLSLESATENASYLSFESKSRLQINAEITCVRAAAAAKRGLTAQAQDFMGDLSPATFERNELIDQASTVVNSK